ncbi:TonB-dependent receptor domain-containing protein, partial [Piscinibacter sp.]|uniref:TonB-dependent receptor domain-containing protein n=1 Tax=Piscinibacter sp. TaxID=1903157 RepID=UPI0037851F5C
RTDSSIRDRSWSLTGKLLHSLGSGHTLVGGWEMEGAQRREDDATWLDGALQEGATGIDMSARTRRRALYLQDEWDPARDWSAYAGLRVETIRSTSDSG